MKVYTITGTRANRDLYSTNYGEEFLGIKPSKEGALKEIIRQSLKPSRGEDSVCYDNLTWRANSVMLVKRQNLENGSTETEYAIDPKEIREFSYDMSQKLYDQAVSYAKERITFAEDEEDREEMQIWQQHLAELKESAKHKDLDGNYCGSSFPDKHQLTIEQARNLFISEFDEMIDPNRFDQKHFSIDPERHWSSRIGHQY